MIKRSNLLTGVAAAAMWLAVSTTNAGATTLAQSNFDAGIEGWSIFADGTNLTHHPTGGNSGGYISVFDGLAGTAFGFNAPAVFLGNKAAAYGGNLHFNLSQAGTGPQVDIFDDITLLGAGLTLVFDTSANPAFFPNWSSYDVALLASAGWKVSSLSGVDATEAQLQQVLGDLNALRIRGEFIGGPVPDTGRLDGVQLDSGPASGPEQSSSVPEPSTFTIMGLGAFVTSWIVRRRTSTKKS